MGWKELERHNDDGISSGAFISFNINAHHKFARIEQIKRSGHREETEMTYNYIKMMKTLKEKSSTTLQMGFSRFIFFLLLELLWLKRSDLITDAQAVPFTRNDFPKGFMFGASSSAYQTEGGANEGGRGPSIWDTFTHQNPDNILDGGNGDVATDSYHRYKEDVGLMKDIGMDAYRFSISWSRILPKGKLRGGVNPEGIKYYDNLINELISKGIKPFVTLFHWDLPQALQDDYTGFLSPLIVNDFRDYAELCFKKFGDRVKHWITVNEPYGVSITGYSQGIDAPGRCSPWVRNCRYGDSGTEPYLVGHNLLLAHAAAVQLYRDKFQESQKGTIGITLAANWLIPYSDTSDDRAAQRRAMDFLLGRFLNPLTFGTYPNGMKKLVGTRLPQFTEAEALLVKGSFDFLGLNYYSTSYVAHANSSNSDDKPTAHTDPQTIVTNYKDGIPLGIPDEQGSFFIVPEGLQDMLLYVKKKYRNPTIYITESGFDQFDNGTLPLEKALKDDLKMRYYSSHYQYSLKAIQKGVDLKGFFIWSFLDDFEWSAGYTNRFGLVYVDYNNGRKRLLKQSALWLKDFLNAGVQKQKQMGVADSK